MSACFHTSDVTCANCSNVPYPYVTTEFSITERMGVNDCMDLWEYLKHGDQKHQAWLLEAILCWSSNRMRPDE